ncbi:MAG: hypothetical protein Q9213_003792 [Squamulea squamosa]
MPENEQSSQSNAPVSTTNLDPEKGSETPPQEKDEQVRKITGFKWFLFLSSTLTGLFIYALDNTIVADIVPVTTLPLRDIHLLRSQHPGHYQLSKWR